MENASKRCSCVVSSSLGSVGTTESTECSCSPHTAGAQECWGLPALVVWEGLRFRGEVLFWSVIGCHQGLQKEQTENAASDVAWVIPSMTWGSRFTGVRKASLICLSLAVIRGWDSLLSDLLTVLCFHFPFHNVGFSSWKNDLAKWETGLGCVRKSTDASRCLRVTVALQTLGNKAWQTSEPKGILIQIPDIRNSV